VGYRSLGWWEELGLAAVLDLPNMAIGVVGRLRPPVVLL
jgi:hypothetical protein